MTTRQVPCDASPDCLHLACEHCGRGIRTGSATSRDHPRTRAGNKKDRACRQCKKRGGPPPQPHTHCVTCQQPFREPDETLDDQPGTVWHDAHGRCTTCYDKEFRDPAYHRKAARLKRKRQFEASEHEIRDERHVLLSDQQLSHVAQESPHMYWWHLSRRNRLRLREGRTA